MFLLGLLLLVSYSTALNQLSFSGGGSFGAVEIGILKRVVETDNKSYDLYTGISAGALNAGFLSYYSNIKTGIQTSENIYSTLRNHMIYSIMPPTGISVFNTEQLFDTITKVVGTMRSQPVIHTLIGAVNLYSGSLDVYTYEDNDDTNKVLLLMSSSAIPCLFPPIEYKGQLYADGGTLSNELLQAEHNGEYLNITFVTPYEGYIYNDKPIDSLETMIKTTINIVLSNFNNPLVTMNQNCKNPIGEINKFFVDPTYLADYNILDFDSGAELINIGYKYVQHKKYKIC